jgi:hypothetical protein
MTTYPHQLDALTDTSFPGRWNRHRRTIIPALVALLAVAAFLLFGPIGVGNGPLAVGFNGGESWGDTADVPVALSLPIEYSGHDPAVIDGVDIVGTTGYPVPRVVALETLAVDPSCSGLWPARAVTGGFAEAGCRSSGEGRLLGSSFGAQRALSPGLTATAELAAPLRGACWVITRIAVHYHVGIRHFTATGPAAYAVCAGGNSELTRNAMNAADGS